MIHSMIRVLDEARSVEFYGKVFGLEVADRIDFDTFTLIYMSNDETGFELELTVNKGRTEPYDLGNGYGHLALSVQEVEVEHKRLTEAGLNPRARSSSSIATASSWRCSSSSPILTATRSKSCSATAATSKSFP